jgi:tetratricopeptide (TPR) repeat protein
MKHHNLNSKETLDSLLSEYKAMSQQGTVAFYEETVFLFFINYYKKTKESDKAFEVIAHALSQHPYSTELYLQKAVLLADNNEQELALRYLDKALLFSPSDANIYLLKAEVNASIDRQADAFEALNIAKSLLPENHWDSVYVVEANIHESEEDYEATFDAYCRALRVNADNVIALNNISLSAGFSCNFQKSIELHKEILDENAYSKRAWFNLGQAYQDIEALDEALEAYDYALVIDEKYAAAYRHCAEICIQKRHFKVAINYYQEYLEQFPNDSYTLTQLGVCYEKTNNLRLAEAFFQSALKLDAYNATAHFQIGGCFAKSQKWQKAINAYETAIALDSTREEYVAALAEAFFNINNLDEADKNFYKATGIAPDLSEYWIRYATFLLDIGASDRALEILDEADIYSFGTELQYCRVACLLEDNQRKQALTLLCQVLQEDYDQHTVLYDLLPHLQEDVEVRSLMSIYGE